MMVITRTKTEAEGSVKYECPERNDSLGKETKQPNLQKEERSDKSLRVVVVTKRGWVVNQINQTYFLKGLRMKKSVCLMAILGAMCMTAAHADTQSVIVDFTGEVRDKTCDISLSNGPDLEVELGEISTQTKKGESGTKVPVIFKLENCTGAFTQRTISLEHDLMTKYPAQLGNLNGGQLSTDHEKVVVQFYQSGEKAAPEGMKPGQTETDIGGNVYLIEVGHVALKAFDDNPTAGPVNAKAMFTVTYQ